MDDSGSACPGRTTAVGRLPGTQPEHLQLSYWLQRLPEEELDRPLLSPGQVASYNRTTGRKPGQDLFAQRDLLTPMTPDALADSTRERIAYMRDQVASKTYVRPDGASLNGQQLSDLTATPTPIAPQLAVALERTQLRCGAYPDVLIKADSDAGGFDRNACSTAHPQEVLQLLAESPNGMRLVRTRYALGWIDADARVVNVPDALSEALVHGPRAHADEPQRLDTEGGHTVMLPGHTSLPLSGPDTLLVATAEGIEPAPRPEAFRPSRRPLTRRALLETAFSFLDSPYGFGGQAGGRDCARLTLDLFESFDLALPRHSGWQAQAGSRSIEVPAGMSETERLALIDQAAARHIVLLHLPGHIMLYLGRDAHGTPMVLHALGEYAKPCPEGGETVVDVRRTTVTTLALGQGSSRTSLLERITRLVLFGAPPSARPPLPAPDACQDDVDARIFYSPRKPVVGQPLRAIATAEHDPKGARLWLWDPDGQPLDIDERVLGGPPYTRWTALEAEQGGHYTAVLGSGREVIACQRIPVRRTPADLPASNPDGPVWEPRWKWERDTENLWAAFVEQLFDYPADDGRTWTNLHSLLRDRDRNLLYGHKGMDEDSRLELEPDCADLPYALRAYFAWKLELPYALRRCTRGRRNTPPACGGLVSNLSPREANSDFAAFERYVNRTVRSGVHSASGRTHPEDDNTDFYPVALTRQSLRPGTVYADPHGHVMMLSKWFPQGPSGGGEYGILMASEAQPDGTVGRRRFWQGSFLFDPNTDHVGAGFKHFRPLVFDSERGTIVSLSNAELRDSKDFAPFSLAQYALSKDAFYDRMDALINPRPLDPERRLVALIDALEESVLRRITAVDNGEGFMAERRFATLEMPAGYSLFETTGPWEDFSTPARDMRLLISIDTVVGFPDLVARQKERYLVDGKPADLVALRKRLADTLRARTFSYKRSDGSEQVLSLADVVARSRGFEMAYNPNDCIERRWAAPPDSAEAETCRRSAPAEQQARMSKYRVWFQERTRPPRGTL